MLKDLSSAAKRGGGGFEHWQIPRGSQAVSQSTLPDLLQPTADIGGNIVGKSSSMPSLSRNSSGEILHKNPTRLKKYHIYILVFTIGVQMHVILRLINLSRRYSPFSSHLHKKTFVRLTGGFISRLSLVCRCLGVSWVFRSSLRARRFFKKGSPGRD